MNVRRQLLKGEFPNGFTSEDYNVGRLLGPDGDDYARRLDANEGWLTLTAGDGGGVERLNIFDEALDQCIRGGSKPEDLAWNNLVENTRLKFKS